MVDGSAFLKPTQDGSKSATKGQVRFCLFRSPDHPITRPPDLFIIYDSVSVKKIKVKLKPQAYNVMIGRGLLHKVVNTGQEPMRLLWLISPPGLEDWFRAIGRPRQPGEPLPPPFERPANVAAIQAQQRFIRAEED